jgi:hypothetical protein
MPDEIPALEASRASLLRQLAQLQDMRPGSVGAVFRRCGKPNCHCARPKDPGHGPHFQFTYKKGGKTVTESLPNREAVRRAEQEVEEFRNFEHLSQALIEVNQKICRLRPAPTAAEPWSTEEKKRLLASIKRWRGR